MHSAFLFHGIKNGMNLGIVNPSLLIPYSSIDNKLLLLIEDVLLNRRDDATENLLEYAEEVKGTNKIKKVDEDKWRKGKSSE